MKKEKIVKRTTLVTQDEESGYKEIAYTTVIKYPNGATMIVHYIDRGC